MKLEELGLTREDLQQFIRRWGIEGDEYMRRGHPEFDAWCPFHDDSTEGRPNWGINLDTGFHRCFSCGAKGDFITLYSHVEQVEPFEAILFLKGLARNPTQLHRRLEAAVERLQNRHNPVALAPPTELHRQTVYRRIYHPYLEQRGITKASFRQWGLRYSKMRDAIVIPAVDEDNTLWGYIYRNLRSDARTRYLYSKGFYRSQILYGFRFWQENRTGYNGPSDTMIVVEGSFDTIWVNQAGLPAVGILGGFPSEHHLSLMKGASQIIVMTDKDKAGVLAAVRIGDSLHKKLPVRIARYPKYADDPSKVKPDHLHRMVERAVPYLLWRRRGRF